MKSWDDGHYFNSTRVAGQTLAVYEKKATAQDDKVLEFLQHNPRLEITAEDINDLVLQGAPETSPRRALSTLFRDGLVEKRGKTEGKYGRPIYVWRLKPVAPTQGALF